MILLENNTVPKYEPIAATSFIRQLSARAISRKASFNSNSFPLQPLDDSNLNNKVHLCRTTFSRCNSSKSATSDLFEKLDLFSQLTPEQLEDLAKACEELQQTQQKSGGNTKKFARSISQQQAESAPYKLSQLMMSTMDQQQPLNQQVPYPYRSNGTACPPATLASNNSGNRSTDVVSALMDFMDDEQNQFDMENLLGGDGISRGPTLGEINTNVPSNTASSSHHAQEVNDITADDVGYILNENQTIPEYLGSWPSSELRQPVFTTAGQHCVPSTLQIPTMAPIVSRTTTQSAQPTVQASSSIPSVYGGGYALPVRNSIPQPLTFNAPLRKPVLPQSRNDEQNRVQQHASVPVTQAGDVGHRAQKTEPASVQSVTPPQRQRASTSKRALYDNDEDTEEVDEQRDGSNSNQKREWWEYNVNHRGQRLDSVISRMRTKPRNNDPHVLPIKEDPVFDAEVADSTKQVLGFNVRHGGKARIGNGNDLTPRPERLRSMKNQIEQLDAKMDSLAVAREDSDKERTRKRREKNRLASRVCRLKRKAQHEANKVLLYGLENEHRELISALDKIKSVFRAKINGNNNSAAAAAANVEAAIESVKHDTLLTDCDLRPQAFVNNIIEGGTRRSTAAPKQQQQQNVQLLQGVASGSISTRRQAKRLSTQQQ